MHDTLTDTLDLQQPFDDFQHEMQCEDAMETIAGNFTLAELAQRAGIPLLDLLDRVVGDGDAIDSLIAQFSIYELADKAGITLMDLAERTFGKIAESGLPQADLLVGGMFSDPEMLGAPEVEADDVQEAATLAPVPRKNKVWEAYKSGAPIRAARTASRKHSRDEPKTTTAEPAVMPTAKTRTKASKTKSAKKTASKKRPKAKAGKTVKRR